MVLIEILYPFLLPVVLCLFSISLWSCYVNSLRDKRSNLPLPPGTVGLPFVGETLHMILQGWKFYSTRREKYGRVYKTHILGKPTIRFWGTDNIKKVLRNEEILVTTHWPESLIELVGEGGLANSSRREHSLKRSAVLSALTNKAMSGYSQTMERIIKKYLDKWCNESTAISGVKECQEMVLEVAARIFIGCRFSQAKLRTLTSNMAVIIDNLFTLPVNLPGSGYHKAMKARGEVITVLKEVMEQSQEDGHDISVLSHLMPYVESGRYTKSEIQDLIIEMFVASYNGLVSLCSSALVNLSKDPQVVTELLRSLDESNLLKDSDEPMLTPGVLSNIPYLQSVWKELARFTSPVGGGFRQVLKTFEIDGYQIPAGWTILYSIRDNHTDEENYSSASEFDPSRWEDTKSQEDFLPFGGTGMRSCVGMKYTVQFFSVFLVLLVKKATWQITDTKIEYKTFPAPLPKNGLPVIFSHRKLNGYH